MSLDFLDPPRPTLLPPRLALIKVLIVNFYTLKIYYLNKHINISLFYSTQCDSLPLICYVLYSEILVFVVILSY